MPIQLDFILRRFAEMAAADPALRDRQPWKATVERDYEWFSQVMTAHYAGDDSTVKVVLGGILAAYAGVTVEDFEQRSSTFLRTATHPTLGRSYLDCGYKPMIELLGYLAANGFANYIASGGGRDFMRPVTQEMYGVPRERVIGSSTTLGYHGDVPGGAITHLPASRLPQRRPGKAHPDLEPGRPAPAGRRRKQQWGQPDARVHRRCRGTCAALAAAAR